MIPAWNEPEAIGAALNEAPPEAVDHVLGIGGRHDDPTACAGGGSGGIEFRTDWTTVRP